MSAKQVYVASPIGFTELGRRHYETDVLAPLRQRGFTVFDPWAKVSKESQQELVHDSRNVTASDALSIGARNADMIRRADVVFAILDGADVDAGVAAELGFAAGIGKRIIAYRGDFRPSGDFVSLPVNAQVVAFVQMTGGRILTSLGEAWEALGETK